MFRLASVGGVNSVLVFTPLWGDYRAADGHLNAPYRNIIIIATLDTISVANTKANTIISTIRILLNSRRQYWHIVTVLMVPVVVKSAQGDGRTAPRGRF